MTACAAKFSSRAICLSVNGRTSRLARAKAPTGAPSLTKATQTSVRTCASTAAFPRGSPER
jgi:hypothetical protein